MTNMLFRHVSPALFERVLIFAAVIETVYLCGLFERRMEVDGLWLALAFTFVIPWLPYLLGLGVTRWHSQLAAMVLIGLTALAWIAGARAGTAQWLVNPVLLVGAVATLCQTAAALMLLTPEGRSWTSAWLRA